MPPVDPLTPRRSKRYQPLVVGIPGSSRGQAAPLKLIGDTIHSRPMVAEDVHEDDEFNRELQGETRFFEGFIKRPLKKGLWRRSDNDLDEAVEFRVGDTVFVETVTQGKLLSIGIIAAVWEVRVLDEENEEKTFQKVKIHWFLRPNELATVRAKRQHSENEIYLSLASTAILSPHDVLRHCTVTSKPSLPDSDAEYAAKKKGKLPAYAVDQFNSFSAIDPLRGIFYDIDWEAHRAKAKAAGFSEGSVWEVVPARGRAKAVKRDINEEHDSGDEYVAKPDEEDESDGSEGQASSDEEAASGDEDDGAERVPRTPSKKRRKRATVVTPRKTKRSKSTIAAPTPHSRAALRARSKAKKGHRKPTTAYDLMGAAAANLPENPWLRVMQVLHVGSRPDALPCRDKEYGQIMRAVESLLEEGSGGCVYVSGVPGTGKTATVHRIVRDLKRMAERNEANPFTYVEINGLKIPEASAAYSLLWEAVSSHDVAAEGHMKISAKEALKQLTRYFSAGVRAGPGGHACIVLMDELDQLLTTKQEVVYNFFNWPTLVNSKLIVIAVANTHDLPERVMTGRVRSRLGMTRINYEPYKKPQLVEIVNARINAAKEGFKEAFPEVLTADGIGFAAAKVASISGDARRVLDICRRAVELVRPNEKAAKIADVKEVITRMQSSLTATYLEDCSLHERIMLASLVKCILKTGVLEIPWGDVQHQHLIYTPVLSGARESTRKPSPYELRNILDGLLASHAVLIEDASGAAARKAEADRKLVLNVEQAEVQRVLGDMGGNLWKTALGV